MTAPATPADAPKDMPKVDPKKTTAEAPLVPLTSPVTNVPSIPVLGGTSGKY